jgi:hypothetical protein
MSERTQHPPSTDDQSSRRVVHRALIGGALGLALLVGPVALATAIVPDDGSDNRVEAAASDTSLVNLQLAASRLDQARASAIRSLRTTTTPPTTTTTTTTAPPTTTTEPPTTTTEPPPPPTEPPPPPSEDPPPDNGGGLGDPNSYATWDALAECESGGDWHINTGNGYYGGLQFSLASWQAVGGTGYPHEHSRETQIAMGQRLYDAQGWGAWPSCTSKLGWR